MALEINNEPVTKDGNKVVYSLNLEDVNSNPDELVDLRGEGRYFGNIDDPLTKESEFLCRNCHEPGHKAINCETIICMSCGQRNDHVTSECPKSITCTNCGEKGHYRNACTKKFKRIFCTICESNRHIASRCPTLWRSYILKRPAEKLNYPFRSIFCYNCATKGHFGDDCTKQRTSKVPNIDGSAFSGLNLPKELRDQYFSLLKRESASGSRAPNFFHYDYQNGDKNKDKALKAKKKSEKKQRKEKKKKKKLEEDKSKDVSASRIKPTRSGTIGKNPKFPDRSNKRKRNSDYSNSFINNENKNNSNNNSHSNHNSNNNGFSNNFNGNFNNGFNGSFNGGFSSNMSNNHPYNANQYQRNIEGSSFESSKNGKRGQNFGGKSRKNINGIKPTRRGTFNARRGR